jgi:hypothetical protein
MASTEEDALSPHERVRRDACVLRARASIVQRSTWPFAERFQLAMREFQGYDIAEGAEYFAAWLTAMSARDSVRSLRPDDEALLRSWRRTMRLDYFDYETASRESP